MPCRLWWSLWLILLTPVVVSHLLSCHPWSQDNSCRLVMNIMDHTKSNVRCSDVHCMLIFYIPTSYVESFSHWWHSCGIIPTTNYISYQSLSMNGHQISSKLYFFFPFTFHCNYSFFFGLNIASQIPHSLVACYIAPILELYLQSIELALKIKKLKQQVKTLLEPFTPKGPRATFSSLHIT